MHKVVVIFAAFLGFTFSSIASAAGAGFSLDDHPGQYLDVLLEGKIVARYMDAYDPSTPERRNETSKPYLHVFDADGKAPITNGFDPKAEYPHHRGIFIGFKDITVNGKKYERWGMSDFNGPIDPKTNNKGETPGEIVHQKFENEKADGDSATFTSITAWNDENAKPFLTEERTMTFRRASAPARITIDFTSKLTPSADCKLDGDPEHGGVQYRPANDIDKTRTLYVFPVEHPIPHKDLDYPWVGETNTMRNGKTYSVVEMSHPDDSKGTKWSAYRDYGRFGAFHAHVIKAGESVTLKYRFLIADGQMPPADVIEASYNQYTGEKNSTPQVTVLPAEKPAPPKPKTPKTPAPK